MSYPIIALAFDDRKSSRLYRPDTVNLASIDIVRKGVSSELIFHLFYFQHPNPQIPSAFTS